MEEKDPLEQYAQHAKEGEKLIPPKIKKALEQYDSETKERMGEIKCNKCFKILRPTQANPDVSCPCGVSIHLRPRASVHHKGY